MAHKETKWPKPFQAKLEPEQQKESVPEPVKLARTIQPHDKYKVQTVEPTKIEPYSTKPQRIHR
jgi:hypothetical protein